VYATQAQAPVPSGVIAGSVRRARAAHEGEQDEMSGRRAIDGGVVGTPTRPPAGRGEQPDAKPTVLVIDDDPSVRTAVGDLLRSLGLNSQLFASVSQFLESDPPDGPVCLVLDVRLPGRSGLDFQRELPAANRDFPIIFITGHGDIPMSVQAMKRGAIDFLTKPFRDQDLLDAIHLGLARDRARRKKDRALAGLRERYGSLSPRERGVMIQVANGRLSKQIAGDIGISEATVKVHRHNVMHKMGARSFGELSRMAAELELPSKDVCPPIARRASREGDKELRAQSGDPVLAERQVKFRNGQTSG